MAYFPNGTSGEVFVEQCGRCRYGGEACPVYIVQYEFNYKAVNNKVASDILARLVKNDGTCMMFKLDPEWFGSNPSWNPNEQPDTLRKCLDALPLPGVPVDRNAS